jgi:large subunit ribosomal protein L23
VSKFADRAVLARDIIIKPVVSEKSYSLLDQNTYTFVVHPDTNKIQIR